MNHYITLSVIYSPRSCNKIEYGGFFTAGIVNNKDYEIINKFIKDKKYLCFGVMDEEYVNLVSDITNENEIIIFQEKFGKLYCVGTNLIERILDTCDI